MVNSVLHCHNTWPCLVWLYSALLCLKYFSSFFFSCPDKALGCCLVHLDPGSPLPLPSPRQVGRPHLHPGGLGLHGQSQPLLQKDCSSMFFVLRRLMTRLFRSCRLGGWGGCCLPPGSPTGWPGGLWEVGGDGVVGSIPLSTGSISQSSGSC